MTITYEINPPKLGDDPPPDEILLEKTIQRASEIAPYCDGLHITESVLGIKRLSPITTGKILKKLHPGLDITISMRVIDRDITAVEKFVNDAIAARVDGILVLKGDPSKDNPTDSGLIPSQIVSHLQKYSDKIRLFLSIHNNPDFNKARKKISAKPIGFVTQVIHSKEQAKRICDELKPKGFQIVPTVLLPSQKNTKSAEFLKLDWSGYKEDISGFILDIHQMSGHVLITSPNDFGLAKNTLIEISKS